MNTEIIPTALQIAAQPVRPADIEVVEMLADALRMLIGNDAAHSLCRHESMDMLGRVKGTWSAAAEANAQAALDIFEKVHKAAQPEQPIKNTLLDSIDVASLWAAFEASDESKRCVEWAVNGKHKGALFVAFRAGLHHVIAQPEQPTASRYGSKDMQDLILANISQPEQTAYFHICPRHDCDIVVDPVKGCPKCNAEMAQPVQPTPNQHTPLTTEDYSAIRGQLCESHPGVWLHHYGPAVEAEVLKRLAPDYVRAV